MKGFLLDTNVISELTRPQPESRVTDWLGSIDETQLYLSVLSLGEIRRGVSALAPGHRRTRLENWLVTELPVRFAGRLLPIDAAIADRWGQVAGLAQSRGKPLPVIDGLLAATALCHDLKIATRNVQDFLIPGVLSFDPWTQD
jgi:predicted nucleic acid-binding protein